MPSITSKEFHKHVGRYQDLALQRPVTITKHGRDHVVMLSANLYARLRQLERQALLAEELPDDTIDAIERAAVPAGHERLDDELDGG